MLEQNKQEYRDTTVFFNYLLDNVVFEDDELYYLYREEILRNRFYDT